MAASVTQTPGILGYFSEKDAAERPFTTAVSPPFPHT